MFIIHQDQNGICNKSIRLIKDLSSVSKTANKNLKCVCEDFPNIDILTKSAMPGEVYLTFSHALVGNKSLGESVTAFALARSLDSPNVV